jgi:hypothetical protein
VVPEVAKRLSVSKQIIQNFDIQRFNLKKMKDVEVKGHIRLKPETSWQL